MASPTNLAAGPPTERRLVLHGAQPWVRPPTTYDYEPSWDYEVADATAHPRRERTELAMREASATLLPAMGLPGGIVFLTKADGLSGALGVFVNGTSSFPMIGIDPAAIRDQGGPSEAGYDRQVRVTIAHYLAHAWYAEAFPDGKGTAGNEEVIAAFADGWADRGLVDIESLMAAMPKDNPEKLVGL